MVFSHAMLAVGYSDLSKAFIVRNSWGADWVGVTSYVLLTYPNYLSLCFEFYIYRVIMAIVTFPMLI